MVIISWILMILLAIAFVSIIFYGAIQCGKDDDEIKEKKKIELANKLIENENKQLKLQIKKLKHQKKG